MRDFLAKKLSSQQHRLEKPAPLTSPLTNPSELTPVSHQQEATDPALTVATVPEVEIPTRPTETTEPPTASHLLTTR